MVETNQQNEWLGSGLGVVGGLGFVKGRGENHHQLLAEHGELIGTVETGGGHKGGCRRVILVADVVWYVKLNKYK